MVELRDYMLYHRKEWVPTEWRLQSTVQNKATEKKDKGA